MIKQKNTSSSDRNEEEILNPNFSRKAKTLIEHMMNLNLIRFLDKFGKMLPCLDVENEKHQKLLFDLFENLAKKYITDAGNEKSSEDSERATFIDYEKYAELDYSSLKKNVEQGYEKMLGTPIDEP